MLSKIGRFLRGYRFDEHGCVFRAMSPWCFLGIPILVMVPVLIREINTGSERIHAPDWVMWIVVAVMATGGAIVLHSRSFRIDMRTGKYRTSQGLLYIPMESREGRLKDIVLVRLTFDRVDSGGGSDTGPSWRDVISFETADGPVYECDWLPADSEQKHVELARRLAEMIGCEFKIFRQTFGKMQQES